MDAEPELEKLVKIRDASTAQRTPLTAAGGRSTSQRLVPSASCTANVTAPSMSVPTSRAVPSGVHVGRVGPRSQPGATSRTSTWQGWENDRAEPRSNKLLMMAGSFSVSPTWLLMGYGDGPTEVIEDEVLILRQELQSVAQDVANAQSRLNAVIERLETFHSYHHVEPN